MKVYSYSEVVKELIRERGGYSILDFGWLYGLTEKFRLQPFYAEGEIVETDDETRHVGCYAEGEMVYTAYVEVIGDMLIDYGE